MAEGLEPILPLRWEFFVQRYTMVVSKRGTGGDTILNKYALQVEIPLAGRMVF